MDDFGEREAWRAAGGETYHKREQSYEDFEAKEEQRILNEQLKEEKKNGQN